MLEQQECRRNWKGVRENQEQKSGFRQHEVGGCLRGKRSPSGHAGIAPHGISRTACHIRTLSISATYRLEPEHLMTWTTIYLYALDCLFSDNTITDSMSIVVKTLVAKSVMHLAGLSALKNLAWRVVCFGKKILVIGCSTGINECRRFAECGARAVHGVDIADEIGSEFIHPRVKYFRMSAESLDLKNAQYDIVYCQATLEHVSDIRKALAEAVRVTKPGGYIYCVASPLWHSTQGHHQGHIFGQFPWIHLRLTEKEIVDYCVANGIRDPDGIAVGESEVRYMLSPKYFNKLPAMAYVEACRELPHVRVLYNQLEMSGEEALTSEIFTQLSQKGFSRRELLATTHRFLARKRK